MAKRKPKPYKLNDIVEVRWLDSHHFNGWRTSQELERWFDEGRTQFLISTVGYFIHENDDFFYLAMSHDQQHQEENNKGDNHGDNQAISKADIKNVTRLG